MKLSVPGRREEEAVGRDIALRTGRVLTLDQESPCTPVHRVGRLWLKREDLFEWNHARGGKARLVREILWRRRPSLLAEGRGLQPKGYVTGGLRQSLQNVVVAQIACFQGVPCRVHTASSAGGPTRELDRAKRKFGAELLVHRPGYLSVIRSRARQDAEDRGYAFIPPGMECEEAFEAIAEQVQNIPVDSVKRIVVPVGGGATLVGVLRGVRHYFPERRIPVIAVCASTVPTRMVHRHFGSFANLYLQCALTGYSRPEESVRLGNVLLDPYYEAKCQPFLRPDDLLWVVGHRKEVLL